MSFVVAIFFTIMIEFGAHCLETRFKARIHLVMLNKIYKGKQEKHFKCIVNNFVFIHF